VAGESDLLDRLMAAQEAERARIGRAIHDGVGQTLTALGLHLRALEEDPASAPVRAELARIRGLLERAMSEVQAIAARVQPDR